MREEMGGGEQLGCLEDGEDIRQETDVGGLLGGQEKGEMSCQPVRCMKRMWDRK